MDQIQGKQLPLLSNTATLMRYDNLDWASYLHQLLPSSLSLLYGSNTYLQTLHSFSTRVSTAFSPLLNRVSTSPDLASIALLLVILVLSLQLLNLLWRAVTFWVRLVSRVVTWVTIIGLGLWLWNRGPDGVMEDIETLATIWVREYRLWQERADVHEAWQQHQQRQTYGTRRGAGNGRWP
jgi:hypothetical protein